VNAWQHPIERCRACGEDILLRPEITPDLRMVYVRRCLSCCLDPSTSGSAVSEADEERGRQLARPSYGGTVGYEGTVGRDPWTGDGDDDDVEARWAAFAARAEREDEPVMGGSSDGTFTFAVEERGRRRFRLPLIQRLRQSA
jgi:hypothetical protein